MKRGASHVEFIISSIMFISFVTFILFLFNIQEKSNPAEFLSENIFNSLKENSSVNVEYYYVSIDLTAVNNKPSIQVSLNSMPINNFVRVENYSGAVLPSKLDGNNIKIEHLDNNLIIIMLSEDFLPFSGNVNSDFSNSGYSIISSNSERIISEKRILKIEDLYYLDYVSLKKNSFKLLGNLDFLFKLEFFPSNFIEAKMNIPEGVDIFSLNERIFVLRSDGTRASADMEVKVW